MQITGTVLFALNIDNRVKWTKPQTGWRHPVEIFRYSTSALMIRARSVKIEFIYNGNVVLYGLKFYNWIGNWKELPSSKWALEQVQCLFLSSFFQGEKPLNTWPAGKQAHWNLLCYSYVSGAHCIKSPNRFKAILIVQRSFVLPLTCSMWILMQPSSKSALGLRICSRQQPGSPPSLAGWLLRWQASSFGKGRAKVQHDLRPPVERVAAGGELAVWVVHRGTGKGCAGAAAPRAGNCGTRGRRRDWRRCWWLPSCCSGSSGLRGWRPRERQKLSPAPK